jgi:hypothetical protein
VCVICIDFQKKLITAEEARRILPEMVEDIDVRHAMSIYEMLDETEESNE